MIAPGVVRRSGLGAQPSASGRERAVDVAVIGGGLAGLATAIQVARLGRRAVCIEARPWPRSTVGESLEFSAPQLLADLGIEVASDGRRHLFPKTSVRVGSRDEEFSVWPPEWFARPPIWCSRRTFHTDRVELDAQLMRIALDCGVEILEERAVHLDHDRTVIESVTTDGGTIVRASWYVDASGHACRLVGRALGLERSVLGPPRVAYWGRFSATPDAHATGLHFPAPTDDDLAWAWEIPLNPSEVSIGVVMSSAGAARLRRGGRRPQEIFRQQLAAIPRLRRIVEQQADAEILSTTYTPYRYRRPVGPNWLLVGDASAMVDPLTSNGVTSALRHADQAARFVTHALAGGDLGRRHRWAYRHTAPAMVSTLEGAIEAFLYRPAVRQRLGLRWAVTLYAGTGVITNALYGRISPTTAPRAAACAAVLAASRSWTRVASVALPRLARLGPPRPVRGRSALVDA